MPENFFPPVLPALPVLERIAALLPSALIDMNAPPPLRFRLLFSELGVSLIMHGLPPPPADLPVKVRERNGSVRSNLDVPSRLQDQLCDLIQNRKPMIIVIITDTRNLTIALTLACGISCSDVTGLTRRMFKLLRSRIIAGSEEWRYRHARATSQILIFCAHDRANFGAIHLEFFFERPCNSSNRFPPAQYSVITHKEEPEVLAPMKRTRFGCRSRSKIPSSLNSFLDAKRRPRREASAASVWISFTATVAPRQEPRKTWEVAPRPTSASTFTSRKSTSNSGKPVTAADELLALIEVAGCAEEACRFLCGIRRRVSWGGDCHTCFHLRGHTERAACFSGRAFFHPASSRILLPRSSSAAEFIFLPREWGSNDVSLVLGDHGHAADSPPARNDNKRGGMASATARDPPPHRAMWIPFSVGPLSSIFPPAINNIRLRRVLQPAAVHASVRTFESDTPCPQQPSLPKQREDPKAREIPKQRDIVEQRGAAV
eukprot:284817061_2